MFSAVVVVVVRGVGVIPVRVFNYFTAVQFAPAAVEKGLKKEGKRGKPREGKGREGKVCMNN